MHELFKKIIIGIIACAIVFGAGYATAVFTRSTNNDLANEIRNTQNEIDQSTQLAGTIESGNSQLGTGIENSQGLANDISRQNSAIGIAIDRAQDGANRSVVSNSRAEEIIRECLDIIDKP